MRAGEVATVKLVLPEPGEGSKRLGDAVERTGGGADPVWLPALDGVATAGGMEGERQAGVPALSTGRPGGANPRAQETRRPGPGASGKGHGDGPKMEHGLHHGPAGRRTVFSGADISRSV